MIANQINICTYYQLSESAGSQCRPLQPSAHLGSNSEATAAKTNAVHKATVQTARDWVYFNKPFLRFAGCFFTAKNLTKFCPKILPQAEGKQPGTGLQGWGRSAPCLYRTRSRSYPVTGDACPKSSSKSHMKREWRWKQGSHYCRPQYHKINAAEK